MADASMVSKDSNDLPRFINMFCSLLQRVTELNDTVAGLLPPSNYFSAFLCLEKPEISIAGYLEHIFRFSNCSSSCFMVAYIYLSRLLLLNPSLAINSFNAHRLLLTAVLSAAKFMDDRCYNNAYFAKVGGITLAEMNCLEVDFLFGLNFKLNVTLETFLSYCSKLRRHLNEIMPPIPPNLRRKEEEKDEEPNSICKQMQLITFP